LRPGSVWDLWWTKRHWGRFSLSTSVFPANHHSTNFSIIIITRGWHNRPIGGRSVEWTQLDSTPHYTKFILSIYLSVSLSVCLSMVLQPSVGPWPLFQFLDFYTVGRTSWTGDHPVARPLHTHRTAQTQNKRTQTSMSQVGFEPTIQVLERVKTVHALDRAAAVFGPFYLAAGRDFR
jgi:hypothetical protein